MKTRTIASATGVASSACRMTPVSRAKSLVAGDAAERETETDARLDAAPSITSTAWKPMSLVSSSVGDAAAAVERDVELARQAVERAIVEDVDGASAAHRGACRSAPADRCRRWASR